MTLRATLTQITHSPFAANGTNPVSIVVKPQGRYVYVVNAGSGATGTPGTTGFVSAGQGNLLSSPSAAAAS